MLRSLELGSSIAATILGLAGLGYAVFGLRGPDPMCVGTTDTCPSQRLLPIGQPTTAAVVFILLVLIIGISVGAYLHRQQRRPAGRWLLWVATVLLLSGVYATGFSIGSFLLPAALLSVVAAVAGAFSPARP